MLWHRLRRWLSALRIGDTPALFKGAFVRSQNHSVVLFPLFKGVFVCPQGHSAALLALLEEVFAWLPVGTIIDRRVLVVHGGVSCDTDLHWLENIDRHQVRWLENIDRHQVRSLENIDRHQVRSLENIDRHQVRELESVDRRQ